MEHQVLSSFSTSFSQSVASKPSGGSKSSQPSSVGHKSSGKTSSSTNSKPNSKPKKGSTSSKNYNFLLNHKSNPLTKKKMGSHERQILERKQANTKITTYKSLGSSKGLSACLFIMDDSIRLMEWLAYHYTIMPLQYLVVGIDPHSKHPERVIRVLKRWQQLMDITILEDDQVYLSEVPYDKAWKRKYWIKPGVMNPLYRYKNSTEYRSQEHKRRQNIFTAYCFRQHFQQGRDWVMTLDSDEFLIFNYPGTDEHTNSSNFVKDFVKTNATVIRERQDALDIREHLPPLSQRITVADVLQQTALERCLRLPALNFTAHEGRLARRDSRLLTMRQTRTGPKEGRTTKVLLDLSRAQLQYLTWEKVVVSKVENRSAASIVAVVPHLGPRFPIDRMFTTPTKESADGTPSLEVVPTILQAFFVITTTLLDPSNHTWNVPEITVGRPVTCCTSFTIGTLNQFRKIMLTFMTG
jgi:hypothetical protein